MLSESERRQQFLRRNPQGLTGAQQLGAGRQFEPIGQRGTGSGRSTGGAGRRNFYDAPRRPAIRANLVERDNEDEFLEFHWNPTSYKIKKSSSWKENAVQKGHPTLEWTGVGLTEVTFEALFNNIAQPHAIQRSVEGSLQWLFDRLRPRSKEDAAKRQGRAGRVLPWMNLRDPKASQAPPVLVLFGVSRPFTCVLANVDVTTVFQGQNPYGSSPVRSNPVNPLSGGTSSRTYGLPSNADALQNPLGDPLNLANELDAISRATVNITLKEYVLDPSKESK
jgi:hypothetical protein